MKRSDYNNLLDIRSDQNDTCDAIHSLGQNAKKGDIREDVKGYPNVGLT